MPNVPISGLPLTTSVCATALVPIVQNGVTCSTYACLLGSGGGGGGVTQITAGCGVTISPSCGTGNVTICATGGGGGVMGAGSGTCSIQGSGCGNIASGNCSFAGGGLCNIACGNFSFAGGGCNNISSGVNSFVGGGTGNLAIGNCSFIGGGSTNTACGIRSTILGGLCNTASCNYTGVFGCNLCNTQPCTFMANNFVIGNFVGCGGCTLALDSNGKVCVTSGGGGIMVAGIGTCSTIRCGVGNTATNTGGGTLSGCCNVNVGNNSIITGGCCNNIQGGHSFIGGGCNNKICLNFFGFGNCATIGGGINNCSETSYGVIAGGANNCMIGNAGLSQVIGGGSGNIICSFNNGGGNENAIFSGLGNLIINCSNVAGPETYNPNLILGGAFNYATQCNSSCYGGALVISGAANCATNSMSTVINGAYNVACGIYSLVSGCCNTASGNYSTVMGCCSNDGSRDNTFVFGCGITVSGAACTTYLNNLCVFGTVSKGSGFFKIPHPDPIKAEAGKFLKHSFVESPTAGDNIYRYNVTTSNCSASIDLPDYYNLLNGNDQVFVNAKNHLGYGFGIINFEQTRVDIKTNSDGDYNILIIGTRKDKLALDSWNGTEVEANEEKKQ